MKLLNGAYDLDLGQLRDEELVVLAKECGYRPAESELLVRFRDWCNGLIGQLARRRGLRPSDREDAAQDAVFGILKAISRYDTVHTGKRNGCPFQAFLRRVVTDRFKDFVKQLWRYQGRYGRVSLADDGPKGTTENAGRDDGWLCEGKQSDPARAVEWKEVMVRFRDFVEQLDETGRGLVDGLVSGLRLRVIANHLRISYDSAKRRRRQLRSELAARLGSAAEGCLAASVA